MRFIAISLFVALVASFWATTPQETTLTAHVDIGKPLTIYAPAAVAPQPVAHGLPGPVAHAIELDRFRDEIGLVFSPPSMTAEEWLIEEAKPEPVVRPSYRVRAPAPLAPDYIEALLTANFLEADLDWARRVGFCESRWDANAKNPRSTAAGLFQFLRSTWDWVAGEIGAGTYDSGAVFDPALNVQAAAWLYYNEGPHHWVCK